MPNFTPEQKADARAIFEGKVADRKVCEFCGGVHLRACPRVKRSRVVYKPDLTGILEQEWEYWEPGSWESDVLFADQVYGDDDEA